MYVAVVPDLQKGVVRSPKSADVQIRRICQDLLQKPARQLAESLPDKASRTFLSETMPKEEKKDKGSKGSRDAAPAKKDSAKKGTRAEKGSRIEKKGSRIEKKSSKSEKVCPFTSN